MPPFRPIARLSAFCFTPKRSICSLISRFLASSDSWLLFFRRNGFSLSRLSALESLEVLSSEWSADSCERRNYISG